MSGSDCVLMYKKRQNLYKCYEKTDRNFYYNASNLKNIIIINRKGERYGICL